MRVSSTRASPSWPTPAGKVLHTLSVQPQTLPPLTFVTETTAKPCDTGTPIEKVRTLFPKVDFSQVDPVFPDKTSPAGAKYFPTKEAIVARGQDALRELYHRPEKYIVVVSHSGFLRTGISGHYYWNADYRIFDFDVPEAGGAPETLTLTQWESTTKGGLGWSWEKTVPIGFGLPNAPAEQSFAPPASS